MATKQDDYVRTAIRMPPDLHKTVHTLARAQDRTFNGQLVAMLRESAAKSQQQTQGSAQ
ncbi:MAG: hypothetical protein WAW73_20455 [Rhodoferax sp.]